MPQGRCSRCFKLKDIQVVLPDTEPVCRGCFIDIDGVQGWLEWQGYTLANGKTSELVMTQLRDNPPTPQEPVEALVEAQPKPRARSGGKPT